MDEFNFDNEIIEISDENNLEKQEVIEEQPTNTPKKKNRKSLKDKWSSLPKKNKIIIIAVSVILLLVVIGVILYFTVFKKTEDTPKEKPVILEKDNYRYENGNLVFLNASSKVIGTYSCKVKDSNKCYVAKLDYEEDNFERIISVYENGDELAKSSLIYNDRFVFINDSEKLFLYDIDLEEEVLEVLSFKPASNSNLVIVKNDLNLYGLIEIKDDTFEYLIRCSYDYLGLVNEKLNYLIAKDKDSTFIIDSTGKKLSKNINIDIKSLDEKYIVGSKNDAYYLYDYNYNELLSESAYISLHDSVIAYVKDKRLYLLDSNLFNLHEEGIRLSNTNYVKKYIYDENNKLLETSKSYDIVVSDNTVKVTIDNEETVINMLEGVVSEYLAYLSYFDGKLYFYSDVEKNDLIGTYTCKNKNVINSSADKLNNCTIYNNQNGYSGIYNNDSVFIYDNATSSNPIYYLYSLKEKKIKGTYSEINLVNNSELSSSIKPVYTSSSFIIAKSATGTNQNNYGVLEITGSKTSGKVEFKYKSIKLVDNYYLLINVDDSYSIYNQSFKKISNEFNYIEIYDNYYVGIINNKLNIYKYDNGVGILESDLSTTSNKFTIDFSNGFTITIDGTTYNYDIEGKAIEGE